MVIPFKVALVTISCFLLVGKPVPQTTTSALLVQISSDSNAVAAERQLETIGADDATTRQVLSDKLPLFIASAKDVKATLLFVQLAGTLKLVSTIPAITALLTGNRYKDMATTLYRQAELLDDPIGAALARMGDPSVPRVADLLQSRDQLTRLRAVRVLTKIGTPTALRALRNANRGNGSVSTM